MHEYISGAAERKARPTLYTILYVGTNTSENRVRKARESKPKVCYYPVRRATRDDSLYVPCAQLYFNRTESFRHFSTTALAFISVIY